MSKQSNKVEKRKRRLAYLKRRKTRSTTKQKAAASGVSAESKPETVA